MTKNTGANNLGATQDRGLDKDSVDIRLMAIGHGRDRPWNSQWHGLGIKHRPSKMLQHRNWKLSQCKKYRVTKHRNQQ